MSCFSRLRIFNPSWQILFGAHLMVLTSQCTDHKENLIIIVIIIIIIKARTCLLLLCTHFVSYGVLNTLYVLNHLIIKIALYYYSHFIDDRTDPENICQ